ncbi:hypothetical protein Microterr_21170 [Microbacterium terricola]|uniref:Uncharacterized protein n=1 Tax=Microbacterium terricola TaxID=344163 RepID=A0ABM8E0J6_9MICO|nr:hypothetical protein Microterr_21170 [Microbacterium terricola]
MYTAERMCPLPATTMIFAGFRRLSSVTTALGTAVDVVYSIGAPSWAASAAAMAGPTSADPSATTAVDAPLVNAEREALAERA